MAGLNNSIFDLPASLEELRRPEDVIKISTRKIQPKASSKLGSFPGSDITFDFTLSGNQWWIPSRSYVAIRDRYLYDEAKGGQIQPKNADNIAPSWNSQDNLWDGCQLTIGGFSLGSRTILAPQVSAYNRRQTKSKSWIEGVGVSAHTMTISQDSRKNAITSDGVAPSERDNSVERLYQPPLGIFSQNKALPPARYELILRPKPDITYKKSVIESTGADKLVVAGVSASPAAANNTAEYLVDDVVFYLAVVDNFERVPDKMSYVLDLEEVEVIPRQIAGNGNVIENFTVSKSTFALGVALQDRRAGTDTRFSPSKFITEAGSENSLTSLQISYGGMARPQPPAVLQKSGLIDYQTYRYLENSVENLGYWDTGGVLTKSDWRTLGPIYGFQWRRVGDDISTNVDVDVKYGAFTNGPHNLLLFHSFRRVIEMVIESGQVTSFLAQDA